MKLFVRVLIRLYQYTLSPFLHWLAGPGAGCKFVPTCSEYFLAAVETHGALRGVGLGARRICRCGPWGHGGYDPVPPPSQKCVASGEGRTHGVGDNAIHRGWRPLRAEKISSPEPQQLPH